MLSNNIDNLNKLQQIKKADVEVLLKKSYRGIWETAIKKYSDSAHFVYELLQNADDCKATEVEFILEESGLWFKHNGSLRFTISNPDTEDEDSVNGSLGHINAITSIGNSTKIDEQKIGKFGIGFKAVFAYSASPYIYDGEFNFKLEHYIVPSILEPEKNIRKEGETVFYFPFNLTGKSSEDAYSEIEEKLNSLFQPTLFLSNLSQINWHSNNKVGSYNRTELERRIIGDITVRKVNVTDLTNNKTSDDNIYLFSRNTKDESNSNHLATIGFFLDKDNKLETGYGYEAFCFFQTKEDTKLAFLLQAPFLLNDSREGIKAGEQWNTSLVQISADLAANSLVLLQRIGMEEGIPLITDEILDIIPYDPKDFSEIDNKQRISFKPFYHSILKKLISTQILPGLDGLYFSKKHAYWASDPELVEVFSNEQVSELMENPNSGWVFTSKGQKQVNQADKPLENYISELVQENLDPKKLLRRITAEFTEKQSDQWLIKFYAYLNGRKSLWDDKESLAVKRPILLNQDRKAVVPFNDDQTSPNIFLPSDRETSYDTIDPSLAADKESLAFFLALGIGEPDLRAEIFNSIIPMYESDFNYNDEDLLLKHFDAFYTFYTNSNLANGQALIGQLQNIQFLATENKGEPNIRFIARPSQVYLATENLKEYFYDDNSVYLLDEAFYDDYLEGSKKESFFAFLNALGVANKPRIVNTLVDASIEKKREFGIQNIEISLTYTNQTITDKTLEGFLSIKEHITLEKSVLLWNFLLEHFLGKSISSAKSSFLGTFKFFPKGYSSYRILNFDSTFLTSLKNEKWLYNSEGVLSTSAELSYQNLNEEYNTEDYYAEVLLEFLGIYNPDAGLSLNAEQKAAIELGRKIAEEGLTSEEIAELIEMISDRKRRKQNEGSQDDGNSDDHKGDIDGIIAKLRRGISKKRKTDSSLIVEDTDNSTSGDPDQDDYSKPAVDYQKKIEKLKLEAESAIEDLAMIQKLNELVEASEKYSYAWFKALLELEYLINSSKGNTQGKEVSIQFSAVERESGTERTLILKHPSRYIPQSIEDIGDLQIRVYSGKEMKVLTTEVVSVKEYSLRAKLKKASDLDDLDLDKVSRVVIDIKNPVFILDELRKAFIQLGVNADFNLRDNLTENIKFIFGPPGTGKTTFLATKEIIPLMNREEKLKILVLTPTNKAGDVLTKRIMESLPDESYSDWLLRYGTTADPDLENHPIVIDKYFDIRTRPRNTTITTIARFAYDYLQPEGTQERLHLKFLAWDYVIIDEASMVNLASIAYILYQMPSARFIIAGDPFQIQPITQIKQWKDHNIYTMVELNRFVEPKTVPHQYEIENLTTQYRSIPTIGNVFSHFTYDGILEHHRTADEQKALKIQKLDFKDINIIKFPVSQFESIYKPNTLNKSNYQIYSSLFTVEFVAGLAKEINKYHEETFKIGIICPYKAQATLVEKLIAQQHSSGNKAIITVGTIHGFQGDECDIIIALFNPPLSIGTSKDMFLNKQNILNVAISRARDYLFILMPDEHTQNVEKLYKISKIEKLSHRFSKDRISVYESAVVEEKMFGSPTHIYDNSFATSHQSVNVYAKPERKYEVRCEEIALDVQIKHIEN